MIEEDLFRWDTDLTDNKSRLMALSNEIAIIQSQVKSARNRWIRADKEIAQIEDMASRSIELRKAIDNIIIKGKELGARLKSETEGLLKKAEVDLGRTFATLRDAKLKLERSLRRARDEMIGLREEVRSREVRIEEEEKRERDLDRRLKDHYSTMEESRRVLEEIKEYEAKISTLDSIQNLYGEYEKRLRENTIAQLEYQTYNYFKRLTDQQAYASCHIDRESYILEVQPLNGRVTIPAWRAGGGHESLFALAERLALLRVMNFSHLLILDEPTDAVDSENIPQLLEYVSKSSRELGQVLLVTHHGYGEEEGVNIIIVGKENGESRVYQELETQ
jgi:DNA repair exonuclease SbcCD ATPase subunit